MWGECRSLIGLSLDPDISIIGVSSMPVSCFVICFPCPLLMCFESFLPFVLSHILLNQEIHIRKALKTRKHNCPGSMKRDCPSLIFAKTQLLFHLCFFFVGHGRDVISYSYLSYLGLSSAVFCDVTHFSAIVAFRWWSRCRGTVDVHSVFILDLYRYCFLFRLTRSGLRVCPSYLKLSFSVVFLGFAELFFYFRSAIVPCLELSVYTAVTGVSKFDYPSSQCRFYSSFELVYQGDVVKTRELSPTFEFNYEFFDCFVSLFQFSEFLDRFVPCFRGEEILPGFFTEFRPCRKRWLVGKDIFGPSIRMSVSCRFCRYDCFCQCIGNRSS